MPNSPRRRGANPRPSVEEQASSVTAGANPYPPTLSHILQPTPMPAPHYPPSSQQEVPEARATSRRKSPKIQRILNPLPSDSEEHRGSDASAQVPPPVYAFESSGNAYDRSSLVQSPHAYHPNAVPGAVPSALDPVPIGYLPPPHGHSSLPSSRRSAYHLPETPMVPFEGIPPNQEARAFSHSNHTFVTPYAGDSSAYATNVHPPQLPESQYGTNPHAAVRWGRSPPPRGDRPSSLAEHSDPATARFPWEPSSVRRGRDDPRAILGSGNVERMTAPGPPQWVTTEAISQSYIPASSALPSASYPTNTVQALPEGHVYIPLYDTTFAEPYREEFFRIPYEIDVNSASRRADEKRRRNATASSRFRDRKKSTLVGLQELVPQLEQKIEVLKGFAYLQSIRAEWYKRECDELKRIVSSSQPHATVVSDGKRSPGLYRAPEGMDEEVNEVNDLIREWCEKNFGETSRQGEATTAAAVPQTRAHDPQSSEVAVTALPPAQLAQPSPQDAVPRPSSPSGNSPPARAAAQVRLEAPRRNPDADAPTPRSLRSRRAADTPAGERPARRRRLS